MRKRNQNSETEAMGSSNVQVKPRKKALYIGAIAMVLAVVLVVFFTIANSYQGRFLNHTTINGLNCSGKTAEEVNNTLTEQAKSYQLTLKERGNNSETITADQISLKHKDHGEIQKLLNTVSPYAWIGSLFHGTTLTTDNMNMDYDEAQLKSVLESLNAFDTSEAKAPTDACIVKGSGACIIQKETQGTKLNEKTVLQAVDKAIQSGTKTLDLDASGCYEKPEIYSTDKKLLAQLNKVNAYLKAKITYDFEGRTISVEKDDIMNMIAEQSDGIYALDQDLAVEFVKTKLSYVTDTFGLSRTFKTHSGNTVTLTGGDYGWCINRDSTAAALMKDIEAAKNETIKPVYRYTAKSRAENDIGGTYVEISIAAQKAWCYQNNKLVVETSVVTGNPNRGNGTPSGGVWAIDAKKSPATLGTIATMGYSSEVTYWMPFNGNVGMHDADRWRHGQYGSSIYLTHGSHGCVNMPLSAAKQIYSIVEIGSPVVVY